MRRKLNYCRKIMKILTYLSNLGWKNQKDMVKVWESNWKEKGFDPIILTDSDADTHPYYQTLKRNMEFSHFRIMKKDLSAYGFSCWARWLAYANQDIKEHFYVSDYDVINESIKPDTKMNFVDNKIVFLEGLCPSISTGNSDMYFKLCKSFSDICKEQFPVFSKSITKLKRDGAKYPHFHDQNFFMELNRSHLLQKKLSFCEFRHFRTQEDKTINKFHHISHRATHEYMLKQGIDNNNDPDCNYRIMLMKRAAAL